jgi:HD-GYP domain-containing protein (c-di-GMP phosphodiesterase class II)
MSAATVTNALQDDLVPITGDRDEVSLAKANEVFLRHGKRFVLYTRQAEQRVNGARLQNLLRSKEERVFIKKLSSAETLQQLGEDLAKTLADPRASTEEKISHLYLATSEAIAEAFATRPTAETTHALRAHVSLTTPFIADNPSAVASLISLVAQEYSTYTHSTGVYIFAIALAAWMGIKDADQLDQLGFGAIMHDIGKTQIPKDILFKPGPLSSSEWLKMRRHPAIGADVLRRVGGLPDLVVTLALQHHERCDGSGYPQGLTRARINPLTHLVIVTDMFDALTRARSYRAAYGAFQALELMKEQTAGRIDVETYRAMVLMLAGRQLDQTP